MRLALVTQGYLEPGGGVTTIVNWLVEGFETAPLCGCPRHVAVPVGPV